MRKYYAQRGARTHDPEIKSLPTELAGLLQPAGMLSVHGRATHETNGQPPANLLVPLHNFAQSLWRNWLARSAVNRKDGGSSPPRDEIVLFCEKFSSQQRVSECCPNAHQEHSSSSSGLNV